MATGGSIESISLDGREFAVAADSDASRKLGGFENEISPNGDGTARLIKTRVTWALDGISVVVDDDRGDQEFLQGIADGTGFVPVGISLVSGVTYQGDGTITGEVQASSQNATAGISLGGPGEMTQQ